MILVATVLLVAGAAGFLARAIAGPSLADRVVALDGLVVSLVAGILLRALDQDDARFLDVAVVVALVGFLGTIAAARFIERRGG